jgi:hypothetical protein
MSKSVLGAPSIKGKNAKNADKTPKTLSKWLKKRIKRSECSLGLVSIKAVFRQSDFVRLKPDP